MSKITVIGIGPGNRDSITAEAVSAISESDVIVSYKYYLEFIDNLLRSEQRVIATGMKQEVSRAEAAFVEAEKGAEVAVISSGDSGIYGMAPLIFEMKRQRNSNVEIAVVPGISAFQKAASLLGAPMGHDFCVVSLSDLMTPWNLIEKRIRAAAEADFITAIYNPRSTGRYWQLNRLQEIFLESRKGSTPVGFVRQAGRDEQTVKITTLSEFNPDEIDMFTIVIIGNSQTYVADGKMITPRGYYRNSTGNEKIGQAIMIESFRTIDRELNQPDLPLYIKWPLLHAIHTTADFAMASILKVDNDAPRRIYERLASGEVKTIVTDVTMVASGIRKGALERLGLQVVCCLNDERVAKMADEKGITRAQAGIRLAVKDYPDALYAFGNAPTALLELCALVRRGEANPCGIVAAPVGFVHVCESKHAVKTLRETPKIIVDGRKGGSNLAATLVNSILCWPDAAQLKPGRDV